MSKITAKNPVAYFSAEYGLQADIPIYAGGLGVLSGDHVKASADLKIPMVAVGLLYKGNDAIQEIDENGRQIEKNWDYEPLDVGIEPVIIDNMPLFVRVNLTTVSVWAKCWKKQIGETVTLYLLDTDTDQNLKSERVITHALYNGTEETLMKQQLLLGIGGVKMLHAMGIHPAKYHVNEGRPAFLHWELISSYMDTHGMSYQKAADMAKNKTVYTNHTLVAAGNESYNIELLKSYSGHYAEKMDITIEKLLEPGLENSADKFVMTRFALNTSHKTNGVSALHSKLCKEFWPEYNWCNITNGVHMPTWQDPFFENTENITDQELWDYHLKLKYETMEYIKQLTGYGYDSNRLVISWARRMAEYKRFNEIYQDIEQLKKVILNEKRPIQILMAGKAHAKDIRAKMLLQEVIHYMQKELQGYAMYIPNYNIDIGKMLTRGSDVWLNTPIFGKEASGTSGMKAVANGVLQCTVKDGWTHEVDWNNVGWELDPDNLKNSFYDIVTNKMAPMYFEKDNNGLPSRWIQMMRKSIKLRDRFSAKRMVSEYRDNMYTIL